MRANQTDNLFLKRERLINLFNKGKAFSCLFLIAAGGYGKTQTMLSYLAAQDVRTGWLSVSILDNNPIYFWKKLIRNIHVNENLTEIFLNQGFPNTLSALHQFLRLFSEEVYKGREYYLVIDDFHLITEPMIIDFFENLIELDMENFHIVLLSRREPHFRNLYREWNCVYRDITAQELAFTEAEIAAYLQLRGIDVPLASIQRIFEYTEGWPVAVDMIVSVLTNNKINGQAMFMIKNSAIYHLIEENFFSKYSEQEKHLLVTLSLFDSLPFKLLVQFASLHNLQSMGMEELAASPFMKYNPHTNTYQLHQIFRDFLASEQQLLSVAEKAQIYHIAALWHQEQGQHIEAQIYYWKGGDWDNVSEMMLEKWKENPLNLSEGIGKLFLEMLSSMPVNYLNNKPMMKIIRAGIYSSLLRLTEAKQLLLELADCLTSRIDEPEIGLILGECVVMQGFLAMIQGEDNFYRYFQQAAGYLPHGSSIFRKELMMVNKDTILTLKQGDWGELDRRVQCLYKMAPYSETIFHGYGHGLEYLGKAEAHYYQGEMKEAEEYAYKAIYKSRTMDQVDIICNAYFILTRIDIYHGSYKGVIKNLAMLREYAESYSGDGFYGLPDISEGWFFARMGQVERVADWISGQALYSHMEIPKTASRELVVKGFCYMVDKNYEEYLAFLKAAEKVYEGRMQFISLISIKIQLTIALFRLERYEAALQCLEVAYLMSWKNKIIMPIVAYGKHICQVIEYIKKRSGMSIPVEWLTMIYRKASIYSRRVIYLRGEYEREQQGTISKAVQLEAEEREILWGLYQGMTREGISKKLGIPLVTVKYILKNIYTKLGAINGVHAVHIALSKGQLEEDNKKN